MSDHEALVGKYFVLNQHFTELTDSVNGEAQDGNDHRKAKNLRKLSHTIKNSDERQNHPWQANYLSEPKLNNNLKFNATRKYEIANIQC